MRILVEKEGKIYRSMTIQSPDAFAAPTSNAAFPCLIWDHEGRFTEADRSSVAEALLDAGCQYAVCAGRDSDAWENAVDMEFVARHLGDTEAERDRAHVMTTSHEGESEDEVAFFFVKCTNFDQHEFTDYLVLHVGTSGARETLNASVQQHALSGEAV